MLAKLELMIGTVLSPPSGGARCFGCNRVLVKEIEGSSVLPLVGPRICCVGCWHWFTEGFSTASFSTAAREAHTTREKDRIDNVKPVCGKRIIPFVSVS